MAGVAGHVPARVAHVQVRAPAGGQHVRGPGQFLQETQAGLVHVHDHPSGHLAGHNAEAAGAVLQVPGLQFCLCGQAALQFLPAATAFAFLIDGEVAGRLQGFVVGLLGLYVPNLF